MNRCCEARGVPHGEVLSLEQTRRLAQAWYHDRLDPAWRRHPTDEAQRVFASVGLTGAFWRLTA